MTTTPWARLGSINLALWSLVQAQNKGWQWSATVPGWIGDCMQLSENALAESQTFVMQIGDGTGFTRTSPKLVACLPVEFQGGSDGNFCVLSGMDLTTWRLSQPRQSLDTFKNTSADVLLQKIAEGARVEIVAPHLNFSVAEEDLHQTIWWDALCRIAEVAVCNVVIDAGGVVHLVPTLQTAQTCRYYPKTYKYRADASKRVTGFVVVKKTSHYTAAKAPDLPYVWDSPGWKIQKLRIGVLNPTVEDLSTLGSIQLAGFWDGDPNSNTSHLIRQWKLDPNLDIGTMAVPQTNTGTATYMTVSVSDPAFGLPPDTGLTAKLRVSGSTPPTVAGLGLPDLDLAFTQQVGVIKGVGARPGPVRNEPLYPSAAWVVSQEPGLLWEANKAARVVTASGPIDCTAVLGGELRLQVAEPIPWARIESINESGSVENGWMTAIVAHPTNW